MSWMTCRSAVPSDRWSSWRPVEGLFDLVQDAIDRNAARLEATFDPATGFPGSFAADYDLAVADEELAFTAGGLWPVP